MYDKTIIALTIRESTDRINVRYLSFMTETMHNDNLIMHLDMDAFFTSVEQADHPELQGKPVIIGQSMRGVASAASYEARTYGVHSAMPIAQAKRLCPDGIYLPGRMHRYREVSQTIMNILVNFSPVVEQASVDEAYLDISGLERLFGPPAQLAHRIKTQILAKTRLTCSIGIAPVRFLAKICSDWNKPNGLTILSPQDVRNFLAPLPVGKIPGIGKHFQDELASLGIHRIHDVLQHPRIFWQDRFGKRGLILFDRANGFDPTPVTPGSEAKSCSAENTFDRDTKDTDYLAKWLLMQADRVGRELRGIGKKGMTVTLKLKYSDFSSQTRSHTLAEPTDLTAEIYATALKLLHSQKISRELRLIGVSVSNFRTPQRQLSLFPDEQREKASRIDHTLDHIRQRFGITSIVRADTTDTAQSSDLLSKKNRSDSNH